MPYLYRHIRLDKNEIFYIGIGSDLNGKYIRAYKKTQRNNYWKNVVNQTEYLVEIMLDDISWEEACEKEKEFIKLYGRKNLGNGTLVNQTDGGEGNLGLTYSDEVKKKMGAANLGKILSEEHKNKIAAGNRGKTYKKRKPCSEEYRKMMSEALKGKNKGKKRSPEAIINISNSQKGKKHSEETKLKISNSTKGKLKPRS